MQTKLHWDVLSLIGYRSSNNEKVRFMKFKTQVYFLYIVALVVAALIYFTLDGTNDIVSNNMNIFYAVNLFSVVVPAVSLFFSYSWDNLAVNKKRLAQLKADARDRLRKRHVLIKIAFFVCSLWLCTLCYVLASSAQNTKYGVLVALLHGILVLPKSSLLQD